MITASAAQSAAPSDDWLARQYRLGNVDTLRSLSGRLSESAPMGLLLQGVFEGNAESARFHFDRVLALHPGTEAEGFALDRLWQYHLAKGDSVQARKYWDFLRKRHPDYALPDDMPLFRSPGRLAVWLAGSQITEDAVPEGNWTVQVGAFSDSDRAHRVGKLVERYGAVILVTRPHDKGTLTAVQVGRFATREDAEKLRSVIQAATDLQGRVIAVDYQ